MKFSVVLPIDHVSQMEEFVSPAAIAAYVKALEAAGIDACNVTDHPIPADRWLAGRGHHALEPFTALSYLAAASTKLRLQTNLVVLGYRNPFLTAKAAATLDVLSGGRLILGVGAGYMPEEFAALGANFKERGALMDEALAVLKQVWTGQSVTYKGRHFEATGNTALPVPVQMPHPPLWIGGNSERAIRRTVQFGDAWMPFWATAAFGKGAGTDALDSPAMLKEKVTLMHRLCDEAGRQRIADVVLSPEGFTIAQRVRLETQKALDLLGAYRDAGMTWASLTFPAKSRAEWLEHIDWLGRDVAPRLR